MTMAPTPTTARAMSRNAFQKRRRATSGRSEEGLRRGVTQVVVRAHRMTVCTGGRDQENVSLPGRGQQAVMTQHIGTLADRADDIRHLGGCLVEAGEIDDLVVGPVQSRTNQ